MSHRFVVPLSQAGHCESHLATIQKQGTGLLAVGVFFAVNLAFNNVSLLSISLSLNQVIR